MVAVEDRRDPADVFGSPGGPGRAASRRAGRRGSRPGRLGRQIRAQRRHPARIAGVDAIRDVEETRQVRLAAADPLDDDRLRPAQRRLRPAPPAQTRSACRPGRPRGRPSRTLRARETSCSRLCVAIREVRIRARPGGVAGESTQLTKTPSSWRRWTIRSAVRSSPTTTGTTGVLRLARVEAERARGPPRRTGCSPRGARGARAPGP